MPHLTTDVLVIGSGGAGMYAAIEAARLGASVLLVDRSLIGRGGATVMAQMTVAAAVGLEGTDHWRHHLADTLKAGRGLCDPGLARLLCEDGVEVIRQMDAWHVGWARDGAAFRSVQAPGHDRPRCVYVDFLSTGPAVSKTLRAMVQRTDGVRRLGDVLVTDLVVQDGAVTGAVAVHIETGDVLTLAARATIVATGGLTRLYRRNSASANMAGDGYALALRAGASLIDMEFVQFFPIGHLAPRLIGMDPIMWDPFRYKLGGRLLNGRGEEFVERYGSTDAGRYVVTRDLATYAITKEVEAGRGSPHGGAWLSFRHIPEAALRAAFGPVIDRLAKAGIDLTRDDVEVAPIAHYHMGGIRVDTAMATGVPGLFAAGEAVGGANGANRLSGNAITEALAFGRAAGRSAAGWRGTADFDPAAAAEAVALAGAEGAASNTAALFARLQAVMAEHVGPFRSQAGLAAALQALGTLRAEAGTAPPGRPRPHDLARVDWFDLRQALLVADCVIKAALARTESRGAHQREDFPAMDDNWLCNQIIWYAGGHLSLERRAVPA
ncbi:MAG TPA: FAD-binding protein [Rhodopila sp.]|uniref:FAD-binding protein n=1 Tax=Rhodopila sp. TaxID=2480087 RepID=UPI002BF35AF8|nr:FAD-binding protein [Rhodopila sp.]HVY15380.1 FAD-binding protein [Rhodopila sp.]